MAHNLTEAALPVALAIRADGGWDSIGGWTDLGLLTAMLVLLVRVEYALVYVARAEAGLPVVEDTAAVAAPQRAGLARLRRMLSFAPFFRAFVAIEFCSSERRSDSFASPTNSLGLMKAVLSEA